MSHNHVCITFHWLATFALNIRTDRFFFAGLATGFKSDYFANLR
jgi:hypothetical protein